MISKKISSLRNPQIKSAVRLRESAKMRKTNKKIIFEGLRELSMTAKSEFMPHQFFLTEGSSIKIEHLVNSGHITPETEIFYCSKEVFKKIALRDESQNIVCIGEFRAQELPKMVPKCKKPIFVVIEGIEKPGNIGAIFRTADALCLDGIIILSGGADVLSPNSIRASLGTVFTVPWAYTDIAELSQFFTKFAITPIAAYLDSSSTPLHATNFDRGVALLLGSEAQGLSAGLLNIALCRTIIPMHGVADSLNVSVASALIAYEACRQQGRLAK